MTVDSPPARRLGPLATRDGLRGFHLRPFVESSTFDVDTGFDGALLPSLEAVSFVGDTRWTTVGAEVAYGVGWASLGAVFGVARVEDDRVDTAEADSCPALSVDLSIPLLQLGRWDVVTRGRVGVVSGDVSAGGPERSDLRFVHADLDVGVAYAIRRDTEFALSPYGGCGFRRIDGVQDFGSSRTLEFDGGGIYVFGGAELEWLPTDSVRLALGGHALLGQVQGFVFSFSAGF